MKGILFYHSNSGNTRLACEYLQQKLPAVELTLHNVAVAPMPDLSQFEVVGFRHMDLLPGITSIFPTIFNKVTKANRQNGLCL